MGEKGQEEFQLVNREGMREIQNHHKKAVVIITAVKICQQTDVVCDWWRPFSVMEQASW